MKTFCFSDNVVYDCGYAMKAEDGRVLAIPAHFDSSITLLTIYANEGLQVGWIYFIILSYITDLAVI